MNKKLKEILLQLTSFVKDEADEEDKDAIEKVESVIEDSETSNEDSSEKSEDSKEVEESEDSKEVEDTEDSKEIEESDDSKEVEDTEDVEVEKTEEVTLDDVSESTPAVDWISDENTLEQNTDVLISDVSEMVKKVNDVIDGEEGEVDDIINEGASKLVLEKTIEAPEKTSDAVWEADKVNDEISYLRKIFTQEVESHINVLETLDNQAKDLYQQETNELKERILRLNAVSAVVYDNVTLLKDLQDERARIFLNSFYNSFGVNENMVSEEEDALESAVKDVKNNE